MAEGCLDHQHFRDCYHVHEKIRTRLSFCKRELVDRMVRELHQTDDMMKRIPVWMTLPGATPEQRQIWRR